MCTANVSDLLQWTVLLQCRRCCSSDLSLHGNQNYMFLRRNEKCNLMEHFVCRWFFKGLSRYKAEELLMQTHNCTGAFLVRESESNPGWLFLLNPLFLFCLSNHTPCPLFHLTVPNSHDHENDQHNEGEEL